MGKSTKPVAKKVTSTAKKVTQVKKTVAKKPIVAKTAKKVVTSIKKTVSKVVVKPTKAKKQPQEIKKSFAEQKRINIAAQQKKKHDMKTLTNLGKAQATKNREAADEVLKKNADAKANGEKIAKASTKKVTVNRQLIWDKLADDIHELTPELQNLLKKGVNSGHITEDEILTEVDDLDAKIKTVEKFYELAEKMSIKIVTIEELFEQENKQMQQ